MTEPAPSQGERTMSEDAKAKVDGKLISDIEFEVGMGAGAWDQVEPEELIAAVLKCCGVVPKSALDAERARADAMRAFISELREAVVCDEGFEERRLKLVREMLAEFDRKHQPERSEP